MGSGNSRQREKLEQRKTHKTVQHVTGNCWREEQGDRKLEGEAGDAGGAMS